jgi:hypothetical protein
VRVSRSCTGTTGTFLNPSTEGSETEPIKDESVLVGLSGRQWHIQGPGSPIKLSTMVPLTRTGPKSILLVFGHCPTHQVGEGLSKRWDGMVCIDSEQAHTLSCLTLML